MAAMNQTPSKDHGADFSRVRTFCLNGWGRAFRQTVVLAPYVTPDTNALFREECASLRGRVRISHARVDGVVQRIAPKVRQLFQRMALPAGLWTKIFAMHAGLASVSAQNLITLIACVAE